MKIEKIAKPITVWKKRRLDLMLSQIAEQIPMTKIVFQQLKYQEFAAACDSLKSRGSIAKAELAQKKVKYKMSREEYLKNIIRNTRLTILITVILATLPANAKDFDTKGHTYQIIEQPFLKMIDERLQKVDMQKEQEKMTAITKDRVANPRAVEGVSPATKNRVFHFDPTYTLDEDAVLPCGKILHKAGTKVNPLEHMVLNRRLFFIDSGEKAQIKWLQAQLNANTAEISNAPLEQKEPIEDRIILVAGSVFKLKEELGKEHENKVYFDQNGELTTKFGIKASPAIVVQDGLLLKIEEIKLPRKEENKIDKLNKSND